jgi:FkbM family methyltransferase
MSLISKTLHYIGQNFKDVSVIQVGAMDGINFDDTRGFLDMYRWKSLLIEPIPDLFNELKNNFKDRDNYTFEQSAITEFDGEIEMLTIPNEIIEKENLHPGYKGMSALYPLKNGFGSDYQRDIDVKTQFGVNIKVPALTLDSLFKKHNIQEFDVLICDAEGYDWNIFKQLDLTKYKPKFIRLEYINLTKEEQAMTIAKLKDNGYVYEVNQDIDAVLEEIWDKIQTPSIEKSIPQTKPNITIVSGLWDISRTGRNFEEHYVPRFKEFLQIEANMILFIPSYLEKIVWEYRDPSNTFVKIFELEDIKNLYSPHWDKTQEIRTSDKWLNITGEGGWLKSSPQATLEWYNPIVQSKMFMLHDASIWNPFSTDYFFWLDAGITNTVPVGHLVGDKCLDKIIPHSNPFLFISYPYESAGEIHGFDFQAMNQIAGSKVKYVCRGGLFGGHKDQIHDANSMYYTLLQNSLSQGYMGTEESIFTLMSYIEPHLYRRYMLDDNGLVVKFTENLIKDNITLEPLPTSAPVTPLRITDKDLSKYKTNLYILTFNFPEQLLHTIESMKKTPEWLEKPHLVLLDNSTDEEAKSENEKIAAEYKFEYIHLGGNTGICGGRQYAAEHFDNSDADFMFFFEDDMTANPPEYSGQFCRNGFRKYIPNLYNIVHKIMLKENFDFLKLSYTEVYMDNNIQVSWYNVPQEVRTRDWPHYSKLPVTGLDPNAPRTKFKNINVLDSVSYVDGEIYYANWPMIASKAGNKKMFIDTKWAHPYEQTWMSHMYQETVKGNLNPAILLASPIWHDRIKYYKPEERREN